MSNKILMALLAVLVIFIGHSALCQQAPTNILEKWGFASLVSANGEVRWSAEGEITIPKGQIAVDFLFEPPPIIKPAKLPNQFDFDSNIPKGGKGVKIVFAASEIKDGEARIPMFTPISGKHDKEGTLFNASKFTDYGDKYAFNIRLALRGFGNISVVDLNCFSEGAEHHIYGDVQLFGAKLSNKSKEPLIFRISGGKYVWISGSGTVTTKDGSTINIEKH